MLELGIALGLVASPLAQNAQRTAGFIVDTDNPYGLTAQDILNYGLSAQGQIDALEEQVNEWTGMVEYNAFSKMRTSDSE